MTHKIPKINLLPEYEKERKSVFYLFIALTVITFIAYGMTIYFYFSTKSSLKDLDVEYSQLEDRVSLLRSQVEQAETDSGSLEQAVAVVEDNNILTSILINNLTQLLPDHSYLSNYRYQSREVKLVTQFETLDTVALYTTNLLNTPHIRDTKVDNISTFTLKEEEDNVSITPRYEANFTLQINANSLKGAPRTDE